MSNNERIYRIDQLLNDRKIVSFQELLERLEVSPATLKRDLAYMRDRLHAPIIYDKESNGYRFDSKTEDYALPGLWFSAEEIYALLTMQHLLTNLDASGLLSNHIRPLQSRLMAMLDDADSPLEEIQKRVKIEKIGSRKFNLDHFEEIGFALVKRKKLNIDYQSRSKDENTSREISPQRMIYYRDNWYLDAWCHAKKALRSFSIDAIKRAEVLDAAAIDVNESELDEELSSGYGIFAGRKTKTAILKFSADRSKWVSSERWHPNQEGRMHSDGSYELKIPYSDPRELLMDILKYGYEVEIISPSELKVELVSILKKTIEKY